MPKVAKALTAIEVSRLKTEGVYAVGGVSGLQLHVTPSGVGRSWVLRTVVAAKRREFGLGPFPEVTLAAALAAAREVKAKLKQGIDPIAERQEAAKRLRYAQQKKTFQECADDYIKIFSAEWRNAKHRQQWENTLAQYCGPVIGSLPIDQVDTADVMRVLEPIWSTKNETAVRLRGRVEQILSWATTKKLRQGENPARWRGHLDTLLPKPSKIARRGNFAAMRYAEIPAFMRELQDVSGMGARAVEFVILTACRSGEARGATWAEFDLKAKVWVVPAERMKAGKEHRVPLTDRAVKLLKDLPRIDGSDIVFWGRSRKELSDMSLTAVMRRMGHSETVHGFRSSFRDWAAERTAYPREIAEAALAHSNPDKVEAAYLRSDLFEKRREMMQQWSKYCMTPATQADVVSITSQKRESQ